MRDLADLIFKLGSPQRVEYQRERLTANMRRAIRIKRVRLGFDQFDVNRCRVFAVDTEAAANVWLESRRCQFGSPRSCKQCRCDTAKAT